MTATTQRPARAARLGTLGLVGGLAGVGGWLWGLGAGALSPPPLDRPDEWAGWVDRVGAATAAFALLRLLCLLAVAYVAFCVMVGIVAGRSRRAGVRRLAQLVCLPPLRGLLEAVLGIGIGVGALASVAGPVAAASAAPAPAAVAPGGATAPAMVERASVASPTMRAVVSGAAAPPSAAAGAAPGMTLRAVGAGGAGGPAAQGADPNPEAISPPATRADEQSQGPVARSGGPGSPGDYVVEAGDHFWRIAARTVSAALGRDAGEDEIDAYWRRLVEANAGRLADPTNPDLLFAGQTLVLPTL